MKDLFRLVTPEVVQLCLISMTLLLISKGHPVIIYILMIIFCMAIIIDTTSDKKDSSPKISRLTKYTSLTSSILFMSTCIILLKTEHKENIYIVHLTIATIVSNAFATTSYVLSIDTKKNVSRHALKVIKYSWIIISLIAYNVSRIQTSTMFDIPFDITANRPITLFFTIAYILWVYFLLYLLLILALFSPDIVKYLSSEESETIYWSEVVYRLSVLLPLIFAWGTLISVLNMNMPTILKTGASYVLHYETRDNFFCHGQYMFLTKHPDTRFILISEGNYRALIRYKDEMNIFRLTCSDKEPFYSLNNITDKNSLLLTTIKERANTLINDIYQM